MAELLTPSIDYTIPSDNRELQPRDREHDRALYYTIPSDNRELQHIGIFRKGRINYTIPSDNRELQQKKTAFFIAVYYTIPSDNRELQLFFSCNLSIKIIPYQVITGNYNERM